MRLESGLSLQQEVGWDRATVRAARLLAEAQDQPFLVTSPAAIGDQLARWQEAFPLVRPTVAAITSSPATLATLSSMGVAFTFTSKKELVGLSSLAGVDLTSATFANSVKLGSHLRAAASYGVTSVYCDSVEELEKIKRFHPQARYERCFQ